MISRYVGCVGSDGFSEWRAGSARAGNLTCSTCCELSAYEVHTLHGRWRHLACNGCFVANGGAPPVAKLIPLCKSQAQHAPRLRRRPLLPDVPTTCLDLGKHDVSWSWFGSFGVGPCACLGWSGLGEHQDSLVIRCLWLGDLEGGNVCVHGNIYRCLVWSRLSLRWTCRSSLGRIPYQVSRYVVTETYRCCMRI